MNQNSIARSKTETRIAKHSQEISFAIIPFVLSYLLVSLVAGVSSRSALPSRYQSQGFVLSRREIAARPELLHFKSQTALSQSYQRRRISFIFHIVSRARISRAPRLVAAIASEEKGRGRERIKKEKEVNDLYRAAVYRFSTRTNKLTAG